VNTQFEEYPPISHSSARPKRHRWYRPTTLTPQILDVLPEHLLEKPGCYRDEMSVFLYDEFGTLGTASSISRALASIGRTKKTPRHLAKERNADPRDFYRYSVSDFRSCHLLYADKSGCDKRIGFRRTGWSPLGMAPVPVTHFHRDRR